jgi:hypothetical protein
MQARKPMKLRKTPIALTALAVSGAFAVVGAQTSSITIEAEKMSLSSYVKENWRIKTSSNNRPGTASTRFSGASGTYDVEVHVVPETDGQSVLEVYKGSALLRAYKYPLASGTTSFTVGGVALKSGDTIKLIGRPDGTRARVDKIVLKPVAASTPAPAPSEPEQPSYSYSGTPYTGSPIAVPKSAPAVHFDKGGQNVAYNDLSAGNKGNIYRTSEDVDLTTAPDADGAGYAVRDFATGEWLAYTLNVPASKAYDLAVKASNNQSTPASFHIEVDGKDVTGPISVPNTGDWKTFKWVGKPSVNLAAGKRILKVVSDQQYFNINAVSVLASGTTEPVQPPASSYGLYFKTPAPGSILSGTVNSSGCEVAGTGLASVKFSVDTTVLNTDDSAPWQCGIDTLKLTNGAHTLKAAATYTDGTTGSAQVSINVDNGETPPILGDAIDGVTKPASLLYWTGFEKAGVGTPFKCYENGCDQPWTGSTEPTGFSYPPNVYGDGTNNRFQLLTDGGQTYGPGEILGYMFNEVRSVTGRRGNSTRVLYSHIAKNGTGSTSPSPSGVNTQNVNMFRPGSEVPEMYISYWLKLQPDFQDKMKSGTWWQVFEWKTADTDRRVQLKINSYGGTPYWSVVLDQRIDPKIKIWQVDNRSVPVPAGDWFKVEIYWKRSGGSDGRVWMAVNGQVIADKRGSNMGPNKSPIDRIMTSLLYTGTSYPVYQWMDDLQIWSTFPQAKAGDPWYDAPYAPR